MGGWATDMLSRRGVGTSWATQQLAARQQPEQPPEVGVTLEGLDTEREAEERRAPAPVADESWQKDYESRPKSWMETAKDAVTGAAEGAYKGLGLNPRELFGDRVGMQIQTAHSASPVASRVGEFGGEVGSQLAAGVGPVVGGVLSGIGNTEGGLEDKARGAVVGGTLGKLGGIATSKLSGLLNRGAASAEREAVSQGLMHSGATRADLGRLDDLGGREYFAQGAKRLGLTGRASKVADRAPVADAAADAERGAIEQAANVDQLAVDPRAVGANMRQRVAGKFPGITPAANAAESAAGYVDNLAPSPAQGAPWRALDKQRQYWGEKANFASGSPENQVRQQMHGAVNQELGDALSLQTPGAGDRWQQLGRDQQVAKELGGIAATGADRARERGLGMADVGAGALGALLSGGNAAGAVGGIAARRALAANQHLLYQGGSKLAGLTQRGAANAIPSMVGPAAGELGAEAAEQRAPEQGALDLLYSPSRGAELGEYRSKFAEAAGRPGDNNVRDLITELAMTDPRFRTQLLPLLSGRGGLR